MVKGFKEYLDERRKAAAPTLFAFYHFETDDVIARLILGTILNEDRKHVDLGKGRKIFFHPAHVEPGQDHLHFRQNGAKLYAINRDGTAHDASHGKRMARWARDGVRDNYSGFTIPKDGLIEALIDAPGRELLLEGDPSKPPVLVPRALRTAALMAASGGSTVL